MKADCLIKTQKAGRVTECVKVSSPPLLPFRSVRNAFMSSAVKCCLWITPISYCKKKGSNGVISHTIMVLYKLLRWGDAGVSWSLSSSMVLPSSLLMAWECRPPEMLLETAIIRYWC